MRARFTGLLIGGVVLGGCGGRDLPMSQLQVREIQTRSYEIDDAPRAVKAVLDVLQDEGFIPKEVNADLGYIYAAKEVDVENGRERFWAKFWHRDPRWNKFLLVECAANVTARKPGVRVRLGFHAKTLDNQGNVVAVETVLDPVYYQNFFARVDKGIYLEREGI